MSAASAAAAVGAGITAENQDFESLAFAADSGEYIDHVEIDTTSNPEGTTVHVYPKNLRPHLNGDEIYRQYAAQVPPEFQGPKFRDQLVCHYVNVGSGQGSLESGRLRPISLTIGRHDRWLISGPNGAGKSTLIDLLTGALPPDTGTVTTARSVIIGVLAQEAALDTEVSAERLYATTVDADTAENTPLTSFGLVAPRDLSRPVGALSVGQQRRLALAMVLANPPDLLVLDEPTNHLSLTLATALEEHLPRYPEAVVVASHDRWLRNSWDGQRLELHPYEGS